MQNGQVNEKFSIGYTYNDLPFHISKGKTFTGPTPTNSQGIINFVFHPSTIETTNIYFNSHGKNTKIYTKIINTEENADESEYSFPDENTKKNGSKIKTDHFVSNIAITKK